MSRIEWQEFSRRCVRARIYDANDSMTVTYNFSRDLPWYKVPLRWLECIPAIWAGERLFRRLGSAGVIDLMAELAGKEPTRTT
jgi:hypothetical protein